MTIFNKVTSQGSRLFGKVTQNAPGMFRKIDNSILRGNAFLSPTLKHFGFDNLANAANGIAGGIHDTRKAINNNLERAVHQPVSQLRKFA